MWCHHSSLVEVSGIFHVNLAMMVYFGCGSVAPGFLEGIIFVLVSTGIFQDVLRRKYLVEGGIWCDFQVFTILQRVISSA